MNKNIEFIKFIENLNSYEIAYLERRYLRLNDLEVLDSPENFDRWLYDKWLISENIDE
jgi:hypothetical protein